MTAPGKRWRRAAPLCCACVLAVAACSSGMALGAGDGNQTTPSTDGGNLVSKVKAYEQGGGQSLCSP